jgi:hypothetical protein
LRPRDGEMKKANARPGSGCVLALMEDQQQMQPEAQDCEVFWVVKIAAPTWLVIFFSMKLSM